MSRLFDGLENFIKNDKNVKWDYDKKDNNIIAMKRGLQGKNGFYTGLFLVTENSIHCTFVILGQIPIDKRISICEFICRLNEKILFGHFQISMDQGGVSYSTDLLWEETYLPSSKTFESLIQRNLGTLDQYVKGIRAVAFDGVTPQKAVKDLIGF